METETDNKPGAADANRDNPIPQPRKRRMAREPKGTGEAIAERATPPANEHVAIRELGPSKIGAVIALLEREEGATLAEMVAATSWLPHTTRAALTGLKKKGHVITKDKRDDVTCYRIANAGA